MDYIDEIYELANKLPQSEAFNLRSQITRAATSVALNIAEGSTGQSDPEQARFLGFAIRSVLETVACLHIIQRRGFLPEPQSLAETAENARILAAKLHAFRNAIKPPRKVQEAEAQYNIDAL